MESTFVSLNVTPHFVLLIPIIYKVMRYKKTYSERLYFFLFQVVHHIWHQRLMKQRTILTVTRHRDNVIFPVPQSFNKQAFIATKDIKDRQAKITTNLMVYIFS